MCAARNYALGQRAVETVRGLGGVIYVGAARRVAESARHLCCSGGPLDKGLAGVIGQHPVRHMRVGCEQRTGRKAGHSVVECRARFSRNREVAGV